MSMSGLFGRVASVVLLLSVEWTIGGSGRLWAAGFQYPLSAVAAPDKSVFVADRNLPGIWKVTAGKAEVYFQASKKFRTPLNAVRCLAIDHQGRLLAGDSATRDVYRFSSEGEPVALTAGGIGIPMSIAVRPDGTLLVADLETHRVWQVPTQGGKPVEFLRVTAPRGLALDDKDRLWILSTSSQKGQLLRADTEGKLEVVVSKRTFRFPHNVAVTGSDTAYVTDGYGKTVWKVDGSAEPQKWISGDPLVNPVGLAVHGAKLLVTDPRAKTVFTADSDGKLTVLSTGE